MGVNKETGLSFPMMSRIADANNIFFSCIPRQEYLDLLPNALKWDGPIMVELLMNPDQPQAPRSLNRRNADGTMNPTKLEDSYPFLPPEVIAEEMSHAK